MNDNISIVFPRAIHPAASACLLDTAVFTVDLLVTQSAVRSSNGGANTLFLTDVMSC